MVTIFLNIDLFYLVPVQPMFCSNTQSSVSNTINMFIANLLSLPSMTENALSTSPITLDSANRWTVTTRTGDGNLVFAGTAVVTTATTETFSAKTLTTFSTNTNSILVSTDAYTFNYVA